MKTNLSLQALNVSMLLLSQILTKCFFLQAIFLPIYDQAPFLEAFTFV
jgi:hypothetical protein